MCNQCSAHTCPISHSHLTHHTRDVTHVREGSITLPHTLTPHSLTPHKSHTPSHLTPHTPHSHILTNLSPPASPAPHSNEAFFFTDTYLNLTGANAVINRSVVIHVANRGEEKWPPASNHTTHYSGV